MPNDTITITRAEGYAVVTLNRPGVLNALSGEVMRELVAALEAADADTDIRCIVLTGSDRAFAAGADIREMAEATPADMIARNQFALWERIRRVATPVIAAVGGFALGGGCELAMACDIIIAAESARFGQPEILIGVMPGAGGTQRLTRAVGKAKAMEMVLTGRTIGADEAFRRGLVNAVVPSEALLTEARAWAAEIAAAPPLAARAAKAAVLRAFETTLGEGLAAERKTFQELFATEDQKEGMRAFLEKRRPQWKGM
ncbi:MAG TPA: enoyl-CoA hydratase-related protein [Bacteroidota bacterium]|nr:enoyl-CoA hydratase-related protein [Bacteroidota bacterium]